VRAGSTTATCAAARRTGSTSRKACRCGSRVGPRDIAKNGVFLARRDTGEKRGLGREELVQTVGSLLDEMQAGLYQRALELREANTRPIDSLDEFREYFTPRDEDSRRSTAASLRRSPVDQILKDLKVTIRCVPSGAEPEPASAFSRASRARAARCSPRRIEFSGFEISGSHQMTTFATAFASR
jgi:hypothetical protein